MTGYCMIKPRSYALGGFIEQNNAGLTTGANYISQSLGLMGNSDKANVGLHTASGALKGASIGANPALMAATGGLSVLAGGVIGGVSSLVGGLKDKRQIEEQQAEKLRLSLQQQQQVSNQNLSDFPTQGNQGVQYYRRGGVISYQDGGKIVTPKPSMLNWDGMVEKPDGSIRRWGNDWKPVASPTIKLYPSGSINQTQLDSLKVANPEIYKKIGIPILDGNKIPMYGENQSDIIKQLTKRKFALGGRPTQKYEVEQGEVVQGQDADLEAATPIASDLQEVNGEKHSEGGVEGQGGERVFSDTLKIGKELPMVLKALNIGSGVKANDTYASVAALIGKKKGKMEDKLTSHFVPSNNTAKRTLPRLDGALDLLFNQQEESKLDNNQTTKFQDGGEIDYIGNTVKQYPGLGKLINPSDYTTQTASGRMKDILNKNKYKLEYIPKGEDKYIAGTDTVALDNNNKNRILINPDMLSNKERQAGVNLDLISHGLNNSPDYTKFSKDLETKLITKYGKGDVDRNGGVAGYVRGYLSDSPEYQPYKKELEFLGKSYFKPLDTLLGKNMNRTLKMGGRVPKYVLGGDPTDPPQSKGDYWEQWNNQQDAELGPLGDYPLTKGLGANPATAFIIPNIEMPTPTAVPVSSGSKQPLVNLSGINNFAKQNEGQLINGANYLANLGSIRRLNTNVNRQLITSPQYNYNDRSGLAKADNQATFNTTLNALGTTSQGVNASNAGALYGETLNKNNQINNAENIRRDTYNENFNQRSDRVNGVNTQMINQGQDEQRDLNNYKRVEAPLSARNSFMQGYVGNKAIQQQKSLDNKKALLLAGVADENGVLTRFAKKMGFKDMNDFITNYVSK